MKLNVRQLKSSDYDDILVKWWEDWGWIAPSKDFLPNNAESGLMIMDEDIPVCAGFLYMSNSKVAWVDWIVSNKEYRKKPHRSKAIELLIDTLTNVSKDNGCKYVYALIKHNGLIETYETLGYKKGDSYTHEMIKIL